MRKKIILNTALLIIYIGVSAVFMSIISDYAKVEKVAVYQQGSQGAMVIEIQERLSRLDLYNGAIDGVFGPVTEQAVREFQEQKGLTVDGIVGDMTLEALGIITSESIYDDDLYLLASVIYGEGRGEPYEGQVAVGAVVLNRVKHPSFPNSVSGVIFQHEAFSCVADGQFNEPVSESAYRAARDALNGWDPSGGAIYYFNPAKATSSWIWSRPAIVTIGDHIFCS